MKKEVVELASELASLAPRRGESEREAARVIMENIDRQIVEQGYDVVYPFFQGCKLEADGEEIECLPGGFRSGEIEGKNLVNSVHNGQGEVESPAISFNPRAEAISATTFYDAPVVAIDPSDVEKVLAADEVKGELEVEWRSTKSSNLLVGNDRDPDTVVMTHYDSLWGGFIDNGFSVSLLVCLLDEIDLDTTLVVFAGSEETSQESPYHCYGYRKFEAEYSDLLEQVDHIKVIDSLGRGRQEVIEKPEIVEKAIVFSQERFTQKTDLIASRYGDVLDVYHSPADKREALTSYREAEELVRDELL